MKRSILLVITLCISYFSYAKHKQYLTQTYISNDLYYSQISDSAFMITHYFPQWGFNSMFVLLPNKKGVLIDTPCETTGIDSLLQWIYTKFGKLELTAIVTGYHYDNLGGNQVLLSEGINVYGADLTKQLVEERREEHEKLILETAAKRKNKRFYNSLLELELTPPNKIFPISEGLKLKIEDEVFEVYFPGESHTIDNTVVYLHKRQILFGGCMIKGLMYNTPGYTAEANMTEWPKSVQKVIYKFPECKKVVPGHGDNDGVELLNHTLNILSNWHKNKD